MPIKEHLGLAWDREDVLPWGVAGWVHLRRSRGRRDGREGRLPMLVHARRWLLRSVALLAVMALIVGPGCGCCDNNDFPDEGQCCCTFVWFPEPFLVDATVNVFVTNATTDFQISPDVLVGVNQNEPAKFEVCVPFEHDLGAVIDIEFRDAIGGGLLGNFRLLYKERCDPIIIPGIRTPIFSPDCGGPNCCCPLAWTNTSTAALSRNVRIEFANADLTL